MSPVTPPPTPDRPGPPGAPTRLAVFISGGGRTLMNLDDRIRAGRLNATIPLVVASAPGLGERRARELGLHTLVIPGEISREHAAELMREFAIDYVVLAGYLKMFRIPGGFEQRVLNIHPALLPGFGGPGMYGRRVHEAVLKAGERESGCTVHFCNEEYDEGCIILQARCPVNPGDTPDMLAARVFELELDAYPRAIGMVIEGRA